MVSAAVGVVAAGCGIGGFTMAAAEDTSRCVSDVVERDLSCRTRISSFSESPGQPRYGSGSARWTVWAFNSAGHSRMDTAHGKISLNHCEVRFNLARVSLPRGTKVQNGRSVVANRAPLLFGCFVARSQL